MGAKSEMQWVLAHRKDTDSTSLQGGMVDAFRDGLERTDGGGEPPRWRWGRGQAEPDQGGDPENWCQHLLLMCSPGTENRKSF